MNKKIINIILISIIFIIFSILFWKDFFNFRENLNEINRINNEIKVESEKFQIKDIKLIENIEIKETPDEKLLENIINLIKNAKEKVYIEIYMFTEKRILNEIIKAKNRWIDVKVILEKNPYMSENINNKTFEILKKSNIKTSWSNPKNYYLNHSKLIIVDDTSIISTWNITYSTFKINKDFFIFTKDKEINNDLIEIFNNDFYGKKIIKYNKNLVLSPEYSRVKIEKLLKSSQKNIKIYIQYLKDEKINSLLLELKKKKNIDIEIIIDKSSINDEIVNIFRKNWIKVKAFLWKKMHSKAILIDNKYLFIWSINFSKYSIDKNREIWILIKNENIINKFIDIFNKDIKD